MFVANPKKTVAVVLIIVGIIFAMPAVGCVAPEPPASEFRIPQKSEMEHWYRRYQTELKPFLEVRQQYLRALEQASTELRQRHRVRINGHDRDYAQYEDAVARVEELRPEYDRRIAELEDMRGKDAERAIEELSPMLAELRELYWQLQVDLGHMTWDMDVIIGWLEEG